MNKKVYCGGGFTSSQLPWMILIIDGFCNKNNIKNIIFEKKIPKIIKENILIKKILSRYNIAYLKDDLSYKNKISILLFIFLNFLRCLYWSITLDRKDLLDIKKSWKNTQILHGIWDTSSLYLKNGDFEPNFFHKFRASLRILVNVSLSKLLKKMNVTTAFMGHTVYSARAMIACLTKNNVDVINHANCNLYRQPINNDTAWSVPSRKIINKFNNSYILSISKNYWAKRNLGLGNYYDAQIALRNSGKSINKIYMQNVIMMHIFRDSPFNLIDRKRLFSDYVEWIYSTLKIIKNSNEYWLLRPHPNFIRWGEKSEIIYNKIYKKAFGDLNIKNIKYTNEKISNKFIFENAKKIVTFSGTSHLEAGCYGIKPIVISDCTLSIANSKLVLKPRTLDQYKKYLLTDSSSDLFKINKKEKIYCQYLLFLRENVLSFRDDIKSKFEYRNDNSLFIKKNIKASLQNLRFNSNFLNNLGKSIDKDFIHTISKKYI